jgi:hypothetical protein
MEDSENSAVYDPVNPEIPGLSTDIIRHGFINILLFLTHHI